MVGHLHIGDAMLFLVQVKDVLNFLFIKGTVYSPLKVCALLLCAMFFLTFVTGGAISHHPQTYF